MEYLKIPLPEFSFDGIAKEKAQYIIQQLLHSNAIFQYCVGTNNGLDNRLEIAITTLSDPHERLVCIVDLLNFLIIQESNSKGNLTFNTRDPATIALGFNKIRYRLYSIAKNDANYTFDKNTFSSDEVAEIHSKINDIQFTLSKLETGQEVIFDEFEAIKSHISNEFESLRTLPVLGKKTFYQLVFGKVASFAGDKIADEILKTLAPQILALLTLQAPHLIESFQKLIQ